MVQTTLKAAALVAALATGVVAGGPPPPPPGPPPPGPPPPGPPPPKPTDDVVHWGEWPEGCTPIKYEPYVCDDDYGKEYTTTYTLYPHDCTLYYEKPTPKKTEWSTWATPTPDPKEWSTWTTVEDPKTWYEWSSEKPDPPKSTWEPYYYPPHPYPPKPTDPAKWAEWEIEKKIIIITIIEEYDVPCSTGWEKETTTIYTTHCGCEETPIPKHVPVKTYTTECPEEWGLGKTVTYTVPYPEYTPKPDEYTWLNWYKPEPVTDEYYSTWAEYTKTKPAEETYTTWAEYTPVEPAKDTYYSTWATYSTPAVVAKPTGWSPVASWEGAASSSTVSKIMVVGAGAVAGLALFL